MKRKTPEEKLAEERDLDTFFAELDKKAKADLEVCFVAPPTPEQEAFLQKLESQPQSSSQRLLWFLDGLKKQYGLRNTGRVMLFLDGHARRNAEGGEPSLDKSIEELTLSVRSYNCLKNANILTIRQLASKTEGEVRQLRNLGNKSFRELQDVLQDFGLRFGMRDFGPIERLLGG